MKMKIVIKSDWKPRHRPLKKGGEHRDKRKYTRKIKHKGNQDRGEDRPSFLRSIFAF